MASYTKEQFIADFKDDDLPVLEKKIADIITTLAANNRRLEEFNAEYGEESSDRSINSERESLQEKINLREAQLAAAKEIQVSLQKKQSDAVEAEGKDRSGRDEGSGSVNHTQAIIDLDLPDDLDEPEITDDDAIDDSDIVLPVVPSTGLDDDTVISDPAIDDSDIELPVVPKTDLDDDEPIVRDGGNRPVNHTNQGIDLDLPDDRGSSRVKIVTDGAARFAGNHRIITGAVGVAALVGAGLGGAALIYNATHDPTPEHSEQEVDETSTSVATTATEAAPSSVPDQAPTSAPSNTPSTTNQDQEITEDDFDFVIGCDGKGNLYVVDHPLNVENDISNEALPGIGNDCISTPGEDSSATATNGNKVKVVDGNLGR